MSGVLDAAKRGTFTEQELRDGYEQSMNSVTGIPLLFPILGETGCRLAEVVGLRVEDVDLDAQVLHIRPNDKRRLKTTGSERSLPLTHTACLALTKDRLRAVECPADVIDQIGGWSRKGVGESYGRGYQVEQLHRWLARAVG